MALETIKIAELPSATQVVGDDYLVVEQPDKTKKATVSQVISDLDLANKSSLTGPGGAGIIGTEDGEGVQKSLDTDRVNTRELWRRALHDLGLTLVDGSFEEGATLTYTTDAIWHMSGAQCYTWSGTFPKSVPAGSTPSTTGSGWITVGGLSLLDEVTEIKNEAVEAKDQAEDARDEARAYALQASELENLYASVSEGLAATMDGQYFQVPQGSGSSVAFKVYKNNAGVAQEVARVPGTAAITGTIREFPTLAAAQADADAGNIPTGSTAYYRNQDDSALAIEVINNAGTLEPTGRKIPSDAISELIFADPSLTPLLFLSDAGGNNVGVFLSDGSFYLIGMSGALQDQYAIRNAVDIRTGISKIEGISELVGSDLSSLLSSSRDAQGVPFLSFSPDGGLFLRGMVGALQDLYAIKHAADIKAGIASIETVEASVEAMKPKLADRTFYALNNSGELVSQAVRVGRVTRRQKTGYNLNSWPQGKLCIDSTGRIYCGYNSAPSHGGSGTVPMLTRSDDDGVSWSDPIQIVTGENYARGTDWWSLGVDGNDNLWGIVRSRGANNQVGITFYNLYKSTDGGTSWVKVGEISSVTQVINDVSYVPELFHDMCYIPTTGRMVTGYHFANSSRVGFMSFDIIDPLNTIVTQDVIAHGEFSTTKYCEPTIAVEYTRNTDGTIYGGLRTQDNAYPSQLYFMNADLTGFTRFNAPESVQYCPMTIRRINGQFVLLTVERYNTGAMNLWFGTPTDFYNMASSNFWKMPIGKIVDEVTVGASNVGVQDMEIHGDNLYFAWSSETKNTYADTYIGKMNMVYPASLINNEYLEGL